MAGLKKSSKKDSSSPNMVLVVALILFIIVSIGMGVFAYYGYEGQDALRSKARAAAKEAESFKAQSNNYAVLGLDALIAEGRELTPDQKSLYLSTRNELIASPDKFDAVKKPLLDAVFAQHEADLKGYNANEAKYTSNYQAEFKKAVEEAKKSRAQLDSLRKEFEDFKGNYDLLVAKAEKNDKDMLDRIQKGNQDALAAALKTNTEFPKLQKLLSDREDEADKKNKQHINEIDELNGQIARLKREAEGLTKTLNDRALGGPIGSQGGGGDVHALMLDISRGLPLWDRPLGKVLRVDPANLLVTIDLGAKAGVKPDLSFNVFTAGPGGKADRQLRGTLEVVRVMNETTSTCRITSLYDDKGDSISLQSDSVRARALRASDDIIREGDLLFNTFFDTHVFIAGSVNFTGYAGDSPAAQNLQLQEFVHQLRRQGVAVDGYLNLLNGQVEGAITPRTRLLIRGDILRLNNTQEETERHKQIVDAYQALKKQVIDQGMFIISAENFAAVTGYRPPQAQNGGQAASTFRPSLPYTGGATVQRFDRAVEGNIGTGEVQPMPDPNKQNEK